MNALACRLRRRLARRRDDVRVLQNSAGVADVRWFKGRKAETKDVTRAAGEKCGDVVAWFLRGW